LGPEWLLGDAAELPGVVELTSAQKGNVSEKQMSHKSSGLKVIIVG
jgi:hypothetical protein